jgi:hypothetical protein
MKQEDTEDELTIFAGRTRLVSPTRPPPIVTEAFSSRPAVQSYGSPNDYVSNSSQSMSPQEPSYLEPHHGESNIPTSSTKIWVPEGPPNEFIPIRDNHNPSHYSMVAPIHPVQDHLNYPSNLTWLQSHGQESLHSAQYQAHDQPAPTYNPAGQYGGQQQHSPIYQSSPLQQGQCSQLSCPELIDLGFGTQGSKLHERWSSFMQDSGVLEGVDRNFRAHQ